MKTCRSHTRRLLVAATELPPAEARPSARRTASIALGESDITDETIDLQTAVPAWLEALADRMAATLPSTLATAERAWDQADHVRLLDGTLRAELAPLLTATRLASDSGVGLLCRLALDASLGWVDVFERRLATLLRLRMRQGAPLLVDERPFLDVEPVVRQLAQQLRSARSTA